MSLTDWPGQLAAAESQVVSVSCETSVYLPPIEELARRWCEIEPMLERATRRTGCYEPIDLLLMTAAGRAGMWLCTHGEEELDAVLVTQVTVFPRRRVMEVLFGGGSNMWRWRKMAVAAIDNHARELGCDHVASSGRPGWCRAWGAEATGDIIMVRGL